MPIESKCLSRLYFFSRWFIALSARCALRQYLLSFFQLMDIIGTISMAFDISFLLGSKANEQDSQIIYGCNIEQTRTYETMSITFLLHQWFESTCWNSLNWAPVLEGRSVAGCALIFAERIWKYFKTMCMLRYATEWFCAVECAWEPGFRSPFSAWVAHKFVIRWIPYILNYFNVVPYVYMYIYIYYKTAGESYHPTAGCEPFSSSAENAPWMTGVEFEIHLTCHWSSWPCNWHCL